MKRGRDDEAVEGKTDDEAKTEAVENEGRSVKEETLLSQPPVRPDATFEPPARSPAELQLEKDLNEAEKKAKPAAMRIFGNDQEVEVYRYPNEGPWYSACGNWIWPLLSKPPRGCQPPEGDPYTVFRGWRPAPKTPSLGDDLS